MCVILALLQIYYKFLFTLFVIYWESNMQFYFVILCYFLETISYKTIKRYRFSLRSWAAILSVIIPI